MKKFLIHKIQISIDILLWMFMSVLICPGKLWVCVIFFLWRPKCFILLDVSSYWIWRVNKAVYVCVFVVFKVVDKSCYGVCQQCVCFSNELSDPKTVKMFHWTWIKNQNMMQWCPQTTVHTCFEGYPHYKLENQSDKSKLLNYSAKFMIYIFRLLANVCLNDRIERGKFSKIFLGKQ